MKAITEEYYVWYNKVKNRVESATITEFLKGRPFEQNDDLKVICQIKCDKKESKQVVSLINNSLRRS